jgi:hypothetical protein
MRRVPFLLVAVLLAGCVADVWALEPAWGGNCLSCHGLLQTGVVRVFGEDGMADPDESGTGAPDHGLLKVFRTLRGRTKSLRVEVTDLAVGDTYAVELKRLRFPGVESGRHLSYGADCDWPEWGTPGNYYTDPAVAYRWGPGPTTFSFDIEVKLDSGRDYYDLVFAVAGRFHDDWQLFYAEEHFYLQVWGKPGDLNCDGQVNAKDINPFVLALTDRAAYEARFPECNWYHADCNGDGNVDFRDINPFIALIK